jgi:hypothetical protein
MDSDELPPERIPMESGQRLPPTRRPPTAIGAASPGPEWERVRNLFPQCSYQAILEADPIRTVFLCWSQVAKREVAITLLDRQGHDPAEVARWLYEAGLLATIHAPALVRIHDVGESPSFAYVTTDYPLPTPLTTRLQFGPLRPAELPPVAEALIGTLEGIHRAGLVHGHLTLASIGLRSIHPLFLDLPRVPRSPAAVTTEPDPVVFPRDDLYAVATILYESAMGRPWDAAAPAPLLSRCGPWRVRRAIQRALDPVPARRWADAPQFNQALRHLPWLPF